MPTYKRFILAAVTLFITINLEAQITTSSISGRMTDMNKKPIIGRYHSGHTRTVGHPLRHRHQY